MKTKLMSTIAALALVAVFDTSAPGGEKTAPKNIVQTATAAGKFKNLVAAIEAAELVQTLSGDGPFTVFAPTDEAFEKLPKRTLTALLKDKKQLTNVLTYHVVPGKVLAADVVKIKTAKTVQGQNLKIDASNGVTVDGARVLKTDVRASNGVIHVIDTVLMPSDNTFSVAAGDVGQVIGLAIERGVPLFNSGNPEACAAIYEVAAASILELGGGELDSKSRTRLERGLAEARGADGMSRRAWALRHALDDVLALQTAKRSISSVTHEAGGYRSGECRIPTPLPEGYPAPTAPGEIEVKHYPLVRRAQISGRMSPDLGMNFAFFPLFNHIKRRDIAMTSPVEMNYEGLGRDGARKPEQWTMSFLYRNTDAGSTGIDPKDERVSIEDVPPTTVVAIGMKGSYKLEMVNRAIAELREWLSRETEWEEAGAPRALFYNGPEVASDAKWSEIQIPVRRR